MADFGMIQCGNGPFPYLDGFMLDMLRMAAAKGGEAWDKMEEHARLYVEEVIRPVKGSPVADSHLRALEEIKRDMCPVV